MFVCYSVTMAQFEFTPSSCPHNRIYEIVLLSLLVVYDSHLYIYIYIYMRLHLFATVLRRSTGLAPNRSDGPSSAARPPSPAPPHPCSRAAFIRLLPAVIELNCVALGDGA